MTPRKLNVLVYTGMGTTIQSVKHALHALRRLLSPNYAVIPLSETVLLQEPWAPTCALLVIPGGADLSYCRVLNGPGNARAASYVRAGGRYLGFCAGGYYGAAGCEFELDDPAMAVKGPRELAFWPGVCRGAAFAGFRYNSEKGARAVRLEVCGDGLEDAGEQVTTYYNGGGVFVRKNSKDNQESKDIVVLARYADEIAVDGGGDKAAIVYCKVGMGAAILTGPHPEFDAVNLSPQPDVEGYDELISDLLAADKGRVALLRACLTKLGLEVNGEGMAAVPSLSLMHLSAMNCPNVDDILHALEEIIEREGDEEVIRGEQDLFRLEKHETRWQMKDLKENLPETEDSDTKNPTGIIDYTTIPKHILIHTSAWPEPKETPHFNHHAFYSSLRAYRSAISSSAETQTWGDHLLYGEVVTSTNTLLEKNPHLLSRLPSGFTLTATTQIAGRGRGANVWIAPPGSLLFSTVIRHPGHLSTSRPIVFLQYIAALAVVEAVTKYDSGYDVLPIRLKWPNDIYAQDPASSSSSSTNPSFVKIGGILSNCSYDPDTSSYQVVLGTGLNVSNARPTTSLDLLRPPHLPAFSAERLLAGILTRFESLHALFLRGGFGGTRELESAYYKYWLHSGQVVSLEEPVGTRREVKVVGITRDWGMLRVVEVRGGLGEAGGREWALQSDENSFDYFRGLVRRKLGAGSL